MTKKRKLKIKVSDEIGIVSSILMLPEDATSLLVLSHGAGANMEHIFMETLAQNLATQKIASLRFNFPYMEKGGGPPDRPKKAHPTILAAVNKASKYAEGIKLLAGGKSFGGRMISQVASTSQLPDVDGIVYFGFPLHAPGKASIDRASHLSQIVKPQLFLQGTRDALADKILIKEVTTKLDKAKLIQLEGADHSFKMLKRTGISHEEMIERLALETANFSASL